MWYSGDQDFEHGTQVAPATSQLHFLVQAYIILFSSPIQLNIGLLVFYRPIRGLTFGNGTEIYDKDKSHPWFSGFWMLTNFLWMCNNREGNAVITLKLFFRL